MEIVFYKTKNKVLQKYMEGYYFISEDKTSNSIRYKTFPNNYSILSVTRFADVFIEEGKITVLPSLTKGISTDIVLRYTSPIEVEYAKAVDEITFYFKPLGLNCFISDKDFISKHKEQMNFIVFPDFNRKMLEIFKTKNRELQLEKLENYWLSKLQVRDFSLMEQLLKEIESSDLTIDEIAKKFDFSRQYINKLFHKHIGKSPAEYRKIHRFRNVIKKRNEIKSLTELSHSNLFYDQSHFNKSFKELANSSPASFFRNVDTKKENIWLYL